MVKIICIILLVLYGLVMLAMCYIDIFLKKKSKNKVHFYVARDKDCSLYVYLGKPERSDSTFMHSSVGCCLADISESQEFGLNPADFKYLKWEDEPVEVFLNMEN